ncbi:MAG TPA: hypothetical protein VMG10_36185 [Gemmataceae bacterium]|nr:hypothetical protein [Gemmataceae bacterium]
MRNVWKLVGFALGLLAGVPWAAWAQVPVPLPAGPVAAPALVPAAPAAPVAAAPQKNLWTFLCLTPQQKAQCKSRFCGSQLGQLINNSLAPPSVLTGGVIPQCCPGPVGDPANLLKPPTSALGAAGRIQADTAAAAARRAAVRYLSTVDCNYWPEARAALIASLRADRNECVRLEAALALQRGCCCNKDTIKALVLTVSGGRDDDNPAEDSPRVRAAATAALEHCLCCYVSISPAPPPPVQPLPTPRRENAPAGPPPGLPLLPVPPAAPPPAAPPPVLPPVAEARLQPASYYERVQSLSMQEVVLEARQVLQKAKSAHAAAAAASGTREHSLSEVFENAFHPPSPGAVAARRPLDKAASGVREHSLSEVFGNALQSPRPAAVAPRPPQRNNTLAEPLVLKPVPAAQPPTPAMTAPTAVIPPALTLAAYFSPSASDSAPRVPDVWASVSDGPRSVDSSQLLELLRRAGDPHVREWAAANLASRGATAPSVVQALASCADTDTSADVQMACLFALLKLRVEDPTLIATTTRLRGASDPRVREAANILEQWIKSKPSFPAVARQ